MICGNNIMHSEGANTMQNEERINILEGKVKELEEGEL